MSYTVRAFCGVTCDEPGCDLNLNDGEIGWFSDMDMACDIASDECWQTIGYGAKDTRHYCVNHIHARCMMCGREAVGNRWDLEDDGWDEIDDRSCALCPDCFYGKG